MRDIALDKGVSFRGALVDAIVLGKPGIVSLVLLSTLTGIYLATRGRVDFALALWTLAGVGLATSGSAVLNNFLDRDIDAKMERTSARALVTGTVTPVNALVAGLALVASGGALLFAVVNPLSAVLTLSAVFIYVVLYGVVLKRRSSLANQIGGIAGALPPVIGYAASTGTVGPEAMGLFLIVAVWQQPHALSLALKYRLDYAGASIPVVPVAKGVGPTKRRILLYTIALAPASLVPYALGMASYLYLSVALVACALFIVLAARFLVSKRDSNMFLFLYSIIYLTAVFMALVLDMVV